MTLKIGNLEIIDSFGGGAHLGPNSKIEVGNLTIKNSGRDGLTLYNSTDLKVENAHISGSGGYGIQQINDSFLPQLGLPAEIDIDKLKQLLTEIKHTTNDKDKCKLIESSFLSDTLAITANSSTIVANLIALA
uniref:right-handed parallel beta-helix repeat-containing protein n=1 Tax=Acinetobacter soli TaxID=487316 RepID=UPI00125CA371